TMLFVLLTGVATWVVYGVLRSDLPIIITNSFSFLLNILMIILRIKYKRGSNSSQAVPAAAAQ
ncbi:MAG: hypothetical protein EOO14_12505, partial [Chitinophagaceae bacterium]